MDFGVSEPNEDFAIRGSKYDSRGGSVRTFVRENGQPAYLAECSRLMGGLELYRTAPAVAARTSLPTISAPSTTSPSAPPPLRRHPLSAPTPSPPPRPLHHPCPHIQRRAPSRPRSDRPCSCTPWLISPSGPYVARSSVRLIALRRRSHPHFVPVSYIGTDATHWRTTKHRRRRPRRPGMNMAAVAGVHRRGNAASTWRSEMLEARAGMARAESCADGPDGPAPGSPNRPGILDRIAGGGCPSR
ncbi:hypothetical protein BH23GEM9_BH23GEM9_32560 [soil metagenome]